ncbi:MAG: GGDEF domain-containing protein, partial [Planctomycetes bacterium]|nr:GGDEF domain-containing protein [Planctomycetota bacterium]
MTTFATVLIALASLACGCAAGWCLGRRRISARLTADLQSERQRWQQELQATQQLLHAQGRELLSFQTETYTDALTGLANRRRLDLELTQQVARAQAGALPLTLLLVDVDHFKQINDQLGHAPGDQCLCAVAQVLRAAVRATDVVARYGGDEFALLLPGATLPTAGRIAERIRMTLAGHQISALAPARLTVSIGLAAVPRKGDGAVLFEQADRALYAAKQAGRNASFLFDAQ